MRSWAGFLQVLLIKGPWNTRKFRTKPCSAIPTPLTFATNPCPNTNKLSRWHNLTWTRSTFSSHKTALVWEASKSIACLKKASERSLGTICGTRGTGFRLTDMVSFGDTHTPRLALVEAELWRLSGLNSYTDLNTLLYFFILFIYF